MLAGSTFKWTRPIHFQSALVVSEIARRPSSPISMPGATTLANHTCPVPFLERDVREFRQWTDCQRYGV